MAKPLNQELDDLTQRRKDAKGPTLADVSPQYRWSSILVVTNLSAQLCAFALIPLGIVPV